jgi:hypothetical protein
VDAPISGDIRRADAAGRHPAVGPTPPGGGIGFVPSKICARWLQVRFAFVGKKIAGEKCSLLIFCLPFSCQRFGSGKAS